MNLLKSNNNQTALSLAIIISSIIIGLGAYKGILISKSSDRYITVKGLVEQIEKADRGVFELNFKVSDNDFNILQQKLASQTKIVQSFLEAQGFAASEISRLSPAVIDLYTQEYGANQKALHRYVINQTIKVNSNQVDLIDKISTQLFELLSNGISLNRNEKSFYLDRFNDLRPQLIVKATLNAKQVAEQLAKATNSQISEIRRANQGVIVLSGVNSSPNQDYDSSSDSLMKKIRVVTTVEFNIE